MFDIGFWELCLIAIIALLVFGPEKLPDAARSAGLWIGRIRRMIFSVKRDIDRELHLQEIQESIKQSDQNVHQFLDQTKNHLNDLKEPISLEPTKLTEEKSDSTSHNTSTETVSKPKSTEQ